MSLAQEKMRTDYEQAIIYRNRDTFKNKLKIAFEEGIFLFAKWGLIIVLAFLTLQYSMNVVSGSQNGTNAILYLQELQNKGYLPKVVNGQIPPKEIENAKP